MQVIGAGEIVMLLLIRVFLTGFILANTVACSSLKLWGDPTEDTYVTQAYVLPEYQSKRGVRVTQDKKTATYNSTRTR